MDKAWSRDASLGDCCQVKVKAEVVPDREAMDRISKGKVQTEDPSAPLNVLLWTDKKGYREKEKSRFTSGETNRSTPGFCIRRRKGVFS